MRLKAEEMVKRVEFVNKYRQDNADSSASDIQAALKKQFGTAMTPGRLNDIIASIDAGTVAGAEIEIEDVAGTPKAVAHRTPSVKVMVVPKAEEGETELESIINEEFRYLEERVETARKSAIDNVREYFRNLKKGMKV